MFFKNLGSSYNLHESLVMILSLFLREPSQILLHINVKLVDRLAPSKLGFLLV